MLEKIGEGKSEVAEKREKRKRRDMWLINMKAIERQEDEEKERTRKIDA